MTIDTESRLQISKRLKKTNPVPLHRVGLLDIEGQQINLPGRFLPDANCLEYHRKSVFN